MKIQCYKFLLAVVCALILTSCFGRPPAGVIPYSCVDDKAYALIAYDGEKGRESWAPFGGAADMGEEIYQTASREFHEETGCVFSVPSADRLKNQKTSQSQGFYTYVARVPHVPPAAIEKSNCGVKDKRRDWVWVPLPSLVRAVENKENVKGSRGKEYPIWERARKSVQKAIKEGLLPRSDDICRN